MAKLPKWITNTFFPQKPIEYRKRHLFSEQLTSPTSEKGKGVVRTEIDTFRQLFLKGESKDEEQWYKFRRAYLKIPIVAAAIDITTDNAIQTVHVSGDNDSYVEEIKALTDKFNFSEFLYNIGKQMLIYGNSFVEIVSSEEGIVDLKILDPITIYVNRDKSGNFSEGQEDAYLQYLPNKPNEPIKFAYNEIVHFKHNPIGETAYGNSVLTPLLEVLQIKLEIESNLNTILDRYAAPLIHVKVGTDEMPGQQSEIDSLSADMEDIYADTEFVTDHRVSMDPVGVKQVAMDLKPPLEYVENQVISGLETPLVFLGRGNVDRAAAETQLDVFDRRTKVFQREIKRTVEMCLFKRHLGLLHGLVEDKEVPKLEWGEPEQRQGREEIRLIIDLKNAGIITAQKANDLLPDEFEETLPLPMENNPQNPSATLSSVTKEPSLDRIRSGRDSRVPKEQKEK